MAYYEAVAEAAKIAANKMKLFNEALQDKARSRGEVMAPPAAVKDIHPAVKLWRMAVFLDGEQGMDVRQWFAHLTQSDPGRRYYDRAYPGPKERNDKLWSELGPGLKEFHARQEFLHDTGMFREDATLTANPIVVGCDVGELGFDVHLSYWSRVDRLTVDGRGSWSISPKIASAFVDCVKTKTGWNAPEASERAQYMRRVLNKLAILWMLEPELSLGHVICKTFQFYGEHENYRRVLSGMEDDETEGCLDRALQKKGTGAFAQGAASGDEDRTTGSAPP